MIEINYHHIQNIYDIHVQDLLVTMSTMVQLQ